MARLRKSDEASRWRGFSYTLLGVFTALTAGAFLVNVLVDPYDSFPFSLPFERGIVSATQRYMYPQIARSKKFDAVIVGTSTSRMLSPDILNNELESRFANLAMNSATAWEQSQLLSYFVRHSGPPKVLIMGVDGVWCSSDADTIRVFSSGFPEWLYDDNPWNDLLYLLNTATLRISQRMVRYWLGVYRENIRHDGYLLVLRPDSEYDPVAAREEIWPKGRRREAVSPPVVLSEQERGAVSTPAIKWLDEQLAALPDTRKVIVFPPVHVSAQPNPGGREDAVESECKSRIVQVAAKRGATVLDWRVPSVITRDDNNYWDLMHFRLSIADRVARDTAAYVRDGKIPDDGVFRVLVP